MYSEKDYRSKVVSYVEHLFHQLSGIEKEQINFTRWDENPDDYSNKEIRNLTPR